MIPEKQVREARDKVDNIESRQEKAEANNLRMHQEAKAQNERLH